jgi:putative ABC transport system ATP-binding protein
MSAEVRVEGISYTWPGQRQPCLRGVNFTVQAGERVFVAGASGSGKSTLLNLLAGIVRPQTGSIHIGNSAIHTLSARALDRFRARHVGLIFQQFNLIPYLDVETNIRLATYFGEKQPLDAGRITALLTRLQLDLTLARRRAGELSVGQQQRVAVARAVINQPDLIIADEPTSALDAGSQTAFMELLMQVSAESDATVIFVSHDQRLSSRFDRVVDLSALNSAGGVSDAA